MRIQLPDFIIADLYKSSLVVIEDKRVKQAKEFRSEVTEIPSVANPGAPRQHEKNWYLGENLRHIIIIVNDNENVYLNDNSLQLLTSILGACKLTLADVAVINYAKNRYNYQQLKQLLQPSYCFLFDLTTIDLQIPFTIPQYQVQQYDDCTFLIASSLQNMAGTSSEAKSEKTKLWNCLKKVFNI